VEAEGLHTGANGNKSRSENFRFPTYWILIGLCDGECVALGCRAGALELYGTKNAVAILAWIIPYNSKIKFKCTTKKFNFCVAK
jgi:hypothetical protein